MPRSFRQRIPSIALSGVLVVIGAMTSAVSAQDAPGSLPAGDLHYLLGADMPPGALGQAALMRRRPLQGYYQPVEIHVPGGAHVALATADGFHPPTPDSLLAGLLVGAVYRLQVTQLPNQPGVELFPTLEIIGRLYPPAGRETQFPIPVHIDPDDLAQALAGRMVTRVIYLEDPQTAIPLADAPRTQRSFDVRPNMDPLHEADRLGRPVAVLRIGSRIPPADSIGIERFMLGSPPWLAIADASPTTTEISP